MNLLVVLEQKNGIITNLSQKALKFAGQLGENTTAVVLGALDESVAENIAAQTVFIADYEGCATAFAEEETYIIQVLAKRCKADLVIMGSSAHGKDLAGRVAARLEIPYFNNVSGVARTPDGLQVSRLVYGGSITETCSVSTSAAVLVLLDGAKVLESAQAEAMPNPSVVRETIIIPPEEIKTRLIRYIEEIQEDINLEEADVIVSGGRGMGNPESFAMLEELASLWGGAVGATRPAIENGWISKVHQIGQSGKQVSPKLYIACGISGAMQHISGILNSKYIIAINKDEEAPIFKIADLGIVGDVHTVIPMLIAMLKNSGG